MKLLGLSEETVENLLKYLETRPIQEAHALYDAVKKAFRINGADGKPLHIPGTEPVEPEVVSSETEGPSQAVN